MMHSSGILPRPERLLEFTRVNRLPVVLQTEASECGLACLAMIASFYGKKSDLTSLRQNYGISAQGATLKELMDIASGLQLAGRALRLETAQLPELQLPCVLHWEMKHFVVLKKVTGKGIVIHDPACGEKWVPAPQVDQLFTGIALELSPSPTFECSDNRRRLTLSHFWTRIQGFVSSLVLLFVLSMLLQLFAVISPYYMQTVIDDVILRSDQHLLTVLALGFGLLLLIDAGTSLLRQWVILGLSSKLSIQMAANVFQHLVRLPLSYFSKRHLGDVVSRFGSLHQIRELLTTGVVTAVIDGLMAVLTLVVMFFYDSTLTFIVLAIVFLYGLLRLALYRPLRLLNEEKIVASAKENSHFMETVRAVQTIKLLGRESERQSQWHNQLADAMNKDIRINRWHIGFTSTNQLLFGVENILVIYFAALSVMSDTMTVGMLYAFISYKTRFISAMDSLIGKWIEFKMLDLHFDRLADIVFTAQEKYPVGTAGDSAQPVRLAGRICARQLTFSHNPLGPPLFRHLHLTVEPGETLAIVGPSGAGKSTLMKCLMGLITDYQGTVTIDDTEIEKIPRLRQQIAAVMQDDQLLSGTVADNIAGFDSRPDPQQLVMAAQLACIHQDIMAMGMQYNTLVGDMGNSLSGGQKQRLLLARALYRRPSILFLDEATSHLDSDNEALINRQILHLPITRVIIAHRIETIRCANRVMQLAQGQLTDVSDQYLGTDKQTS